MDSQKQSEPTGPREKSASLDSRSSAPSLSLPGKGVHGGNPSANPRATISQGLPEIFVHIQSQLSTELLTFVGIAKISEACQRFQIKLISTEQSDVFFVAGAHSALTALEQHLRQLVGVNSNCKAYNEIFSPELAMGNVARMPPPGLKKSVQTTLVSPYQAQRVVAPKLRSDSLVSTSRVTYPTTSPSLPTSCNFYCDRVTFDFVKLTARDRLCQLTEDCKVSISTSPLAGRSNRTLDVVVTGNVVDSHIHQGLEQLKEIVSSVETRLLTSTLPISKELVPAVSRVDWASLKTIMTIENNLVYIVGLKDDSLAAHKILQDMLRTVTSLFSKVANGAAFVLRTGHTVIVKRGDITQEEVDVIVNAANRRLQHYGGVAKAICQAAGGTSFQEESNKLVSKQKQLNEGETAITGGGRLKCKRVLHAVVPLWSRLEKKHQEHCLSLLRRLCYNCLTLTDENGWVSIAFPGLGSGNSGIPDLQCAQALTAGIDEYFRDRPKSFIRCVIFIDVDEVTVGALRSQAQKRYGDAVVSSQAQSGARSMVGTHLKRPRESSM